MLSFWVKNNSFCLSLLICSFYATPKEETQVNVGEQIVSFVCLVYLSPEMGIFLLVCV